MAEVAVHLTDHVFPWLPVRQWVLSVPKRPRPFLHETPEVASAVLAIFLRALRAVLRHASPGAPTALQDSQLGAISLPSASSASLRFITLHSTVERILLHLDLPHRPPRVSPARAPPQAEFDLDQPPAFDLAAPEPIPESDFDQSPPILIAQIVGRVPPRNIKSADRRPGLAEAFRWYDALRLPSTIFARRP